MQHAASGVESSISQKSMTWCWYDDGSIGGVVLERTVEGSVPKKKKRQPFTHSGYRRGVKLLNEIMLWKQDWSSICSLYENALVECRDN